MVFLETNDWFFSFFFAGTCAKNTIRSLCCGMRFFFFSFFRCDFFFFFSFLQHSLETLWMTHRSRRRCHHHQPTCTWMPIANTNIYVIDMLSVVILCAQCVYRIPVYLFSLLQSQQTFLNTKPHTPTSTETQNIVAVRLRCNQKQLVPREVINVNVNLFCLRMNFSLFHSTHAIFIRRHRHLSINCCPYRLSCVFISNGKWLVRIELLVKLCVRYMGEFDLKYRVLSKIACSSFTPNYTTPTISDYIRHWCELIIIIIDPSELWHWMREF